MRDIPKQTEKMTENAVQTIRKGRGIRCFFSISAVAFLYSLAVLAASILSTSFAEGYSLTVSAFLRGVFALISYPLPFSLTETLVLSVPVLFVLFLFRAVIRALCRRNSACLRVFAVRFICVLLLVGTVFINTFGVCYHRRTAEDIFGLDGFSVTHDDLAVCAAILMSFAQNTQENLIYCPDGSTAMPYSFDQLKNSVRDGYAALLSQLPPALSIKPVALSELWTYTHISGMYMPFTGESNINMNFPDYIVAYTAAHEAAHQLGIASEEEANFYAFLACMHSGDAYLQYAAAMNVLEYVLAELDAETAATLASALSPVLFGEFRAYNHFFDKYRYSVASSYASAANDSYLRSQGVGEGVESYSGVACLVTAYLKKNSPALFDI